jgi:5-methyltetrahydrofolate--homocysteine methyltransferase
MIVPISKNIIEPIKTSNIFYVNSLEEFERIEGSISINIKSHATQEDFTGDFHIQLRRPVYGSTYTTTLLNTQEQDVVFKYIDGQSFEFDENNRYWHRVKRVYELATEKWQGQVVMGMVDLGGVLDILASFRGSENLLMDLYDSPEEVKRCIDELKELWFVYFNKINEIIAPCTRGYSQWFHLYGEKPSYILQSDFSYMIGPDMFDEFVAPELAWSASRLDHTLYHMDGIGEIPHLNTLLSIKDICMTALEKG